MCELAGRRAQRGSYDGRVLVAELVPDGLDERQVGKRELRLGAAPPQDIAAQLARPPRQLGGEAGLADTGFPGQKDEPSVAPVRREERGLEP